jgi:hypothetical protein
MRFNSFFSVIIILLFIFLGCSNEADNKINEYNKIIGQIDKFIFDYKKAPTEKEFYELIKTLGYKPSEGCPCYNKISDTEYELYFGLGLGTSMVYNSKTKKWNEEG